LKKEAKTLALVHVAWISINPFKRKSFLVVSFKKERFLDPAAAPALMSMARIFGDAGGLA
jgi:hypothetical protein